MRIADSLVANELASIYLLAQAWERLGQLAPGVLASIKAVSTSVVVFDTAVTELTPLLPDPVEVLFGTQLGGGTDINRALAYCEGLVTRPRETIFVLISDLHEGGNNTEMPGCAGGQRRASDRAAGAERCERTCL